MTPQDRNLRLGEILIQKGWITDDILKGALRQRAASGRFLGVVLVENKRISETQLVTALSEQLGIPILKVQDVQIDWEKVMKFPASLVLEHRCFPVIRDSECVTFAITNPLDAWALKEAEHASMGHSVNYQLVTQSEMKKLLNQYHKYVGLRIRKLLTEESE